MMTTRFRVRLLPLIAALALPSTALGGGFPLRFDSSGDFATRSVPEVVVHHREFTLALWVKTDWAPAEQRLVDLTFEGPTGRLLHYALSLEASSGASLLVEERSGNERHGARLPALGQSLADGQWHHLAGTMKDGRMTVYVDGQAVAEMTANVAGSSWEAGRTRLASRRIDLGVCRDCSLGDGAFVWPASEFRGAMDEIQVWNEALTPNEIMSYKTTAPRAGDSRLAGWWRHEVASSAVAKDVTGRCGDLALMGGARWGEIGSPIALAPAPPRALMCPGIKVLYR